MESQYHCPNLALRYLCEDYWDISVNSGQVMSTLLKETGIIRCLFSVMPGLIPPSLTMPLRKERWIIFHFAIPRCVSSVKEKWLHLLYRLATTFRRNILWKCFSQVLYRKCRSFQGHEDDTDSTHFRIDTCGWAYSALQYLISIRVWGIASFYPWPGHSTPFDRINGSQLHTLYNNIPSLGADDGKN